MTRGERRKATATMIRRRCNTSVRVSQSASVHFGTPVADGDGVRGGHCWTPGEHHGWSAEDLLAGIAADGPDQQHHGWSEEDVLAGIAADGPDQQHYGWSAEDLLAGIAADGPDQQYHGWSEEDLLVGLAAPVDVEPFVVSTSVDSTADPDRAVECAGLELLVECVAAASLMALHGDVLDVAGYTTEGALAIATERGLDSEVNDVAGPWQHEGYRLDGMDAGLGQDARAESTSVDLPNLHDTAPLLCSATRRSVRYVYSERWDSTNSALRATALSRLTNVGPAELQVEQNVLFHVKVTKNELIRAKKSECASDPHHTPPTPLQQQQTLGSDGGIDEYAHGRASVKFIDQRVSVHHAAVLTVKSGEALLNFPDGTCQQDEHGEQAMASAPN